MIEFLNIFAALLTIMTSIFLFSRWSRRRVNRIKNERSRRKVSSKQLESTIQKLLLSDQSKTKPFRGQFGLNANPEYEKRHISGNEQIEFKPRMYLTYWPIFILAKLPLKKKRAVFQLTILGLDDLFQNNKILTTNKLSDAAHRNSFEPSYRHTLCGAAIELDVTNTVTQRVHAIVADIVQNKSGWISASDGGWRETPSSTSSDLFTTMYAINLLDRLSKKPAFASNPEFGQWIDSALEFVQSYCANMLSESLGQYSEMLPIITCQIGTVARQRNHSIISEIESAMSDWTDENGMTLDYVTQLRTHVSGQVTHAACAVRLAFAMFAMSIEQARWERVFTDAEERSFEKMDAADLARFLFLLKEKRA